MPGKPFCMNLKLLEKKPLGGCAGFFCAIALLLVQTVAAQIPTNNFVLTSGALNTARYLNTTTLLPNGLVLVAGGIDVNTNTLSSAELYNPATGTWTNTGSLNTARNWHTATLLTNGLVLIAGGEDVNGNAIASSELYNPATGTWTTTGSLNTPRFTHTATLLTNGLALIAGGFGGGATLASAGGLQSCLRDMDQYRLAQHRSILNCGDLAHEGAGAHRGGPGH